MHSQKTFCECFGQRNYRLWIKNHKNLQFRVKLVSFQCPTCLLILAGFLVILIRFLQSFKILSHRDAQKVLLPKFHFFVIFIIFHDFAMNIMGIKTKNAQSFFRKKVSMRNDCRTDIPSHQFFKPNLSFLQFRRLWEKYGLSNDDGFAKNLWLEQPNVRLTRLNNFICWSLSRYISSVTVDTGQREIHNPQKWEKHRFLSVQSVLPTIF